MRGGDDLNAYICRVQSDTNPGVKFTTSTRIVVFEFHFAQLRYYAGGWAPEEHLAHEHGRIQSEGYELGDFPSVRDALRFTEAYLVDGLPLQDITIDRAQEAVDAEVTGRRRLLFSSPGTAGPSGADYSPRASATRFEDLETPSGNLTFHRLSLSSTFSTMDASPGGWSIGDSTRM